MKIIVINGANINMLGIREKDIYGSRTYDDLCKLIKNYCDDNNIDADIYQSNHEGDLVDKIQQCFNKYDGIVINPGAYTHTSIAIADALSSVAIPAVEVHISDVSSREDFRQVSYIRPICKKTIMGQGINGYIEAIEYLSKE